MIANPTATALLKHDELFILIFSNYVCRYSEKMRLVLSYIKFLIFNYTGRTYSLFDQTDKVGTEPGCLVYRLQHLRNTLPRQKSTGLACGVQTV